MTFEIQFMHLLAYLNGKLEVTINNFMTIHEFLNDFTHLIAYFPCGFEVTINDF